ncbi:MAG: tryptophan synthase subunit alpha [Lachnospiraceae bacterium]|nr:tryptophan synthase subunit alpha [Lachnospiraceae bacterium]
MSNIKKAFENKKAFIGFLTAGDPSLEKTKEYILEMERAGADVIEIGIPFSDPIAEGPVIQAANVRALKAGCTLPKIFDMVEEVRKETQVPLVFLTYANPVFHYGYDAFCKKCQEVGVDGFIIPDIPYEERGELEGFAKKYDLDFITLIAPTSKNRIAALAKNTSGYIYLVFSMGVTGMRDQLKTDISEIVQEIRKYTDTPIAVGFGIHTREQVKEYQKEADGVIVGSAIVRLIEEHKDKAKDVIYEYVNGLCVDK